MKKLSILLLSLLCLASSISAQDAEKMKVAVYVSGGDDPGVNKILGAQLVSAIVSDGTYQAIERTSDFLAQINKEQGYQRSGSVDDSQISELGKQMGVNYVCVADVTKALGSTFIQARLIDVENANIMSTGEDYGSLEDIASLRKIASTITSQLLGNGNVQSFSTPNTSSTSRPQVKENLTINVSGVSFEMIYVQGGTFTMGCTSEQNGCNKKESPTHNVSLSDYYIGKFEVTQDLWEVVMDTNVSKQRDKVGPNLPLRGEGYNYPIYYVSWEECMDFVRELNRITGKQFSLPTEAQWEYAARGGNKTTHAIYSGGSSIDRVAWYDWNSSEATHPVGTKAPNELGIYDMSGNVWEWCSDWYDNYSSSPQTDPTGPYSGSYRVYRGGSWSGSAPGCRVAYRNSNSPGYRGSSLGLRLSLVQ